MDLREGSNTVDLQVPARAEPCALSPTEAGFYRFRVVVEAARNTFSQNDRADSNTIVKGEPRTLVLRGNEVVAAELINALKAEGQIVDSIDPGGPPDRPRGASSTTTASSSSTSRGCGFTDAQLEALQTFVRDLGRGLVMVGGPSAYGAGGYTKTPVEEALPVDMGVRNRQREPDIALVVVIDKSGSMDACHCNTFNGGMGGGGAAPGRPQDRHRQGGDPARRGGADGAGRVRRRRVRPDRPLGHPDEAARRDRRRRRAARGHRPERPDEHLRRASSRRSTRSRTPRPPAGTSSC